MKRLFAAAAVLALTISGASAANFCYVTEFSLITPGGVQVAVVPPLVDQTPVSVSASSAQSAAFSGDTKMVRIDCDTTVSMSFGTNPTATANNMRLPASTTEYFAVTAGQKAAFITNN